MTYYRADIDGLRAVSVLVVLLFHVGITGTSGGYIGVDIFFVISGYLISSIIVTDLDRGRFSFVAFYQRRIARILPSLVITLALTFVLGFFLSDTKYFDRLGKEIFFAAFGISNILFSYGVDYFASDDRYQPLLHTWSLGVEEQFYLLWPSLLILFYTVWRFSFLTICLVAFAVTGLYSIAYTAADQPASYFLLQYRAYELIAGGLVCAVERRWPVRSVVPVDVREAACWSALALLALTVALLDKSVSFPGALALIPVTCAAILILAAPETRVQRALSWQPLVYVGLISYPLYLLHQPAIAFLRLTIPEIGKIPLLIVVVMVCVPLAAAIFKFVETPLRALAKQREAASLGLSPATIGAGALVGSTLVVAVLGFAVAARDGWAWRLYYLNSYSYEIARNQQSPFFQRYTNGYLVDDKSSRGRLLVVGDSIAQQFVLPFASAIGVEPEEINIVSRGSCLLLKDVKVDDFVAGISCDDLRSQLYRTSKKFDVVVIAHNWEGYVENAAQRNPGSTSMLSLEKLVAGLKSTVSHFEATGARTVVMGWQPRVNYTPRLTPNVFTSRTSYEKWVRKLTITNRPEMETGDRLFIQSLKDAKRTTLVRPVNIWCHKVPTSCQLHADGFSYFSDALHFGRNAVPFVSGRLHKLIKVQSEGMPIRPAG